MDDDRRWMQRCLELAARAQGHTSPNPMVGCVIVKHGRAIGEGWHAAAGQPHAEPQAIAAAQRVAGVEALRGATLYVNLEPCNHFGRTPPCTEAIVAAGIGRVVVGTIDPDPRVAGTGCDRLRQAGIGVTVGVEEAACRTLNEGFCFRVTQQRAFGILKYAMTLDGKIATQTGHSAWVTGKEARHAVHRLRSHCDAVIVGGNTVRQDNPLLTTHGVSARSPLRVVLSRSLDLPRHAQLWDVETAPTVVFSEARLATDRSHGEMQAYLRDRGVEVIPLDDLNPHAVAVALSQRGCNTVLWECGGTLAASAIAAAAIQKVWAFVAPKLIGGTAAPGPVGDLGRDRMTEAIALERASLEAIGEDWLICGYLPGAIPQWQVAPQLPTPVPIASKGESASQSLSQRGGEIQTEG